jgi:hypothetical protein
MAGCRRRLPRLLGLLDCFREILRFLAAAAEAFEIGELLLRLREVSRLDIPLAEILVGPEVSWIEGQGFIVESFRGRVVLELAVAEAQPVRDVGRSLELALDSASSGMADRYSPALIRVRARS